MARIIPPDFNAPDQIGLYESERQTLEYLADALPDSYTVFSNVLWARAHSHNTQFGEIDFVVLSPAGHLIVIEQKSGGMTVRNGEIYKHYGTVEKNAGDQLLRSVSAMKGVWQKQHQGKTVAIDYLLYLPDYQLRNLTGLQLDAKRIVHAGSQLSLAQTIQNLCSDAPEDKEKVSDLHNFLTGLLELELDIGKLQSRQERLYRRHEDTLLAWVQRIKFAPYVLRINGCAGSGKTQVAAGLLREALNRDEKARYICFNRPLADSLGKALNLPDHIHTRDQFYDKFLKSQEAIFDYDDKDSNIYEQLEALVERTAIPDEWLVDLLIIDEGQDIPARSLTILRRFLKPNGRLVWLEDPEQNLYEHEPVMLPGAVELVLEQCFRSPKMTLSYLKKLFPVKRELISANPFIGEPPEFHVAESESLAEKLESRVTALLEKGVPLADIAVVSLGSVRRSAIDSKKPIGPYALSTFTGEYSPDGEQIWTKGDLLFDSIFRFKGSQRPFVLLVDVDAESIDEKIVRRLYCGMTRATVGVELFISPQFEKAMLKALPG